MVRVLVVLLATTGWFPAASAPAAEVRQAQGRVEQVQLLRTSELGSEDILLLSLRGGRRFHLPGQRRLPAGSGVDVELRYLPASEPDAIPVACRIRVTAIPIEREGRTQLKRAERPFEIYRNTSPDHDC